jgi:hypothetical protein
MPPHQTEWNLAQISWDAFCLQVADSAEFDVDDFAGAEGDAWLACRVDALPRQMGVCRFF